MAKIKSLEYFRVPPRWLFVKIVDEDGSSGWGEATLEGHSQAVEGCLDAYARRIIGMDAEGGFYRGGPVLMSALSGIDIALWDLKARRLNVPLYQLLGGKVRSTLKCYAWIGGDSPDDVTQQAQVRKDQGFTCVKMNATSSLGWLDSPSALLPSVARLAAVRALGLDAAVDFHGRVHRPMARRLAALLAPHSPLFVEEPLLSEHPGAVRALAQQLGGSGVPVALGERLHSRWDVQRFLADAGPGPGCGGVDILQPDVAHVGGVSELRRVAAMCEAHDVAVAPHCPNGPLALAASVQVMACTPNFAIQEMGLGIHYNAGSQDLTSYLRNPEVWRVADGGYIDLMAGPGLGVEVDEQMVRRLASDAQPWDTPGFVGPGGELREW